MPIVVNKKPNFGRWTGELTDVDPRDYRRGKPSDAWLGVREKRWQYIGLYTDDFIVGMAIVHASYIGNAFCYVYDKKQDLLWEQERTAPAALGFRVDRNVAQGVSSYLTETERIRMTNDVNLGKRLLDVQLQSEGREVDIRAELVDDLKSTVPMQVVTPTSEGDFTFTHKAAGLPILGSIRLGNTRYEFSPEKDFAALDFTIGYPARDTFWNWCSFAGRSVCGARIGLNLVDPIYDQQHNENALWIDGQMIPLGQSVFEYSSKEPLNSWTIQTKDGSVDVIFSPYGLRKQSMDYKLLSSQFQQPFGTFSGTFTLPDKRVIAFDSVPGVVEEHHARW